MRKTFLLILLFILGTLLHIWFFNINEVLRVADSFAYLQMSHYLTEFSQKGFGTGWFGFLYSLPIAIVDFFLSNDFLSAQIINILLFNLGGYFLYQIAKRYLSSKYLLLVIVLYFLSPVLLHFNIHILSENIYIPLFLGLVLFLQNYIKAPSYQKTVFLGLFIALMYLTRGEAFIYLGSLVLLFVGLFYKASYTKIFTHSLVLVFSFFIFVFPYLFHMNTMTGEWGLTNKGASNLRQAELRGVERMDDAGFEQAVAELTPDNHHLIAGFAGGLKYDTPQIEGNLKSYIVNDPKAFLSRIITNQKKLYSKNLPQIIIGDAYKVWYVPGSSLHKNPFLLVILIIPALLLMIGGYKMIQKKDNELIVITLPFFLTASFFFTLFFTLNRYFLVFLPIFLVIMIYGLQELKMKRFQNLVHLFLSALLISIYSLGMYSYFNTYKNHDTRYEVKKLAGEWIRENYLTDEMISNCMILSDSKKLESCKTEKENNLKVMERFPVTTYYANTKQRWLTPYTDNLEEIIEYARYNEIDIFVVDTLDFQTYRPELHGLLDDLGTHNGLELLQVREKNGEKVILYEFKKSYNQK